MHVDCICVFVVFVGVSIDVLSFVPIVLLFLSLFVLLIALLVGAMMVLLRCHPLSCRLLC